MKKYVRMFACTLSLVSIFTGCGGVSKKSQQVPAENVSAIDQKIRELEKGLTNVNDSALDLEKHVKKLLQKTEDADARYTDLLDDLNRLNSKVELKDASFEAILAETKKEMQVLEKKMMELDTAKTDLHGQLMNPQTQRSRLTSTKIEHSTESMKEAKEMMDQGREMLKDASSEIKPEEDQKIKATAANYEKETLQKLLDEALMLYRDGNYKGAIGKWEEVLALEPENLEAKFNIEIANEKIKSISEK